MRRFRKICERHRDRISTFACYYLGNREDAEDVTQEVLLRLWDHWRSIKPEGLPAWITRVTRNACLDALRRRHSYRTVVSAYPDEQILATAADTAPDPADQLEASDFQRQLEDALQHLPEAHRAVVVLREIQGMKYEEIGDSLDLPLNTVKVYLHRGRQQLRQQLHRDMGES